MPSRISTNPVTDTNIGLIGFTDTDTSVIRPIYLDLLTFEQAQLRLCKLRPGTVFLIRFFSEIRILSVAQLSQASLVVGRMLTSTYDFQAKFQLST